MAPTLRPSTTWNTFVLLCPRKGRDPRNISPDQTRRITFNATYLFCYTIFITNWSDDRSEQALRHLLRQHGNRSTNRFWQVTLHGCSNNLYQCITLIRSPYNCFMIWFTTTWREEQVLPTPIGKLLTLDLSLSHQWVSSLSSVRVPRKSAELCWLRLVEIPLVIRMINVLRKESETYSPIRPISWRKAPYTYQGLISIRR